MLPCFRPIRLSAISVMKIWPRLCVLQRYSRVKHRLRSRSGSRFELEFAHRASDLKPAHSHRARYSPYAVTVKVDGNDGHREHSCQPAEQRRDVGSGIDLPDIRQHSLFEAVL